MPSLRNYKTQMRSVSNVRKITKTMEAVATSKMKRAVDAVVAGRDYAELSRNLLSELSEDRKLRHPLLKGGTGNQLVVVISSNRGLCGPYNVAIERSLFKAIESGRIKHDAQAIAIGKHAERAVRKVELELLADFHTAADETSELDVQIIVTEIFEEFLRNDLKEVLLVHTKFESVISTRPLLRKILPVTKELAEEVIFEADTAELFTANPEHVHDDQAVKSYKNYLFEPNEEELLDYALASLVRAALFHALLEAQASEHASRRVAMKNATDNAGSLYRKLELGYNRARQAAITTEITEITAGAEAQKK